MTLKPGLVNTRALEMTSDRSQQDFILTVVGNNDLAMCLANELS